MFVGSSTPYNLKNGYLCNMKLFLLVIGLLALAFAGIAVKILLKKDGQFAGTCASNNPMLNEEGATCGVCGARPEEKCKKDETGLPQVG